MLSHPGPIPGGYRGTLADTGAPFWSFTLELTRIVSADVTVESGLQVIRNSSLVTHVTVAVAPKARPLWIVRAEDKLVVLTVLWFVGWLKFSVNTVGSPPAIAAALNLASAGLFTDRVRSPAVPSALAVKSTWFVPGAVAVTSSPGPEMAAASVKLSVYCVLVGEEPVTAVKVCDGCERAVEQWR